MSHTNIFVIVTNSLLKIDAILLASIAARTYITYFLTDPKNVLEEHLSKALLATIRQSWLLEPMGFGIYQNKVQISADFASLLYTKTMCHDLTQYD